MYHLLLDAVLDGEALDETDVARVRVVLRIVVDGADILYVVA